MPYYAYENHRSDCERCGTPLEGRQERHCSERCRQATRSAAKRQTGRVVCEVCGETFTTRDGRQKRCSLGTGPDADAGPGDRCWELQNAEYKSKADAIDARDYPMCAHCGEETEYAGKGRHRKYCSDRCRVYAHRARKGRKPARSVSASAQDTVPAPMPLESPEMNTDAR